MKFTIIAPVIFLIAATAGAATLSEPCIEEGDTAEVEFETDLDEDGMPTDGEIDDDSVEARDSDLASDDDLGAGRHTVNDDGSHTLSVEIGNKAGSLSGPNGESQTGGTEGDCIEVYIRYKMRYKQTVSFHSKYTFEPWGMGHSEGYTISFTIWETSDFWTTKTKTVCAC